MHNDVQGCWGGGAYYPAYPNYWTQDDTTETETIVEVTETEKNGKKKTVTKTTTKTSRTPRRYNYPWYASGGSYFTSDQNTLTINGDDINGNAETVTVGYADSNTGTMKMALNS